MRQVKDRKALRLRLGKKRPGPSRSPLANPARPGREQRYPRDSVRRGARRFSFTRLIFGSLTDWNRIVLSSDRSQMAPAKLRTTCGTRPYHDHPAECFAHGPSSSCSSLHRSAWNGKDLLGPDFGKKHSLSQCGGLHPLR